jgi:hypothetical protein
MSGTHVFYNNVLMRDCELIEFDQLIENEKSGTDPKYSRFRITVASTLISLLSTDPEAAPPSSLEQPAGHLSTVAIPHSGSFKWTLPDRIEVIQQRLQEHRKDFWFAINGATYKPQVDPEQPPIDTPASNDQYRVLLAATGLDREGKATGNLAGYYTGRETAIYRREVIDADHGPKTSNVRILKIDGGRACRVQVTIEVCRYIKSDASEPATPPTRDAAKVEGVISNRWSIRESLDDDQRTSITVEGVLIVSDHRYKADAMRLMTSTHLIPYAKMTGREFYVAENGLELQYRYNMQERGPAPPELIVNWDGTYTEKMEGYAMTNSVISLKIRGTTAPPAGWSLRAYKLYMLDVLMKMIGARIRLDVNNPNRLPGFNPHDQIVKDFTLVESMNQPELSVSCVIQHAGDQLHRDFLLRVDSVGRELPFANYDPRWWPIPPAFTWDVASMNSLEKKFFGSNYDMYSQTPQDSWHGKPRGWAVEFAPEERTGDLDSVYIVAGPGGAQGPALSNVTINGFASDSLNWSDEHTQRGASYISVESENKYAGDRGKMALPLSKPRVDPYGATGPETSIAIAVHAGITLREFVFNCTRQNDWPKIPAPKDKLLVPPVPGQANGAMSETLLKATVVPFKPDFEPDGRTGVYTVQCRFVYMTSRAPEAFRVPRDPRINPVSQTPIAGGISSDQELPIAYLYDFNKTIENV